MKVNIDVASVFKKISIANKETLYDCRPIEENLILQKNVANWLRLIRLTLHCSQNSL